MRPSRPPCPRWRRSVPALLLMLFTTIQIAAGDEALHEFVLPRRSREDIPMPVAGVQPADAWSAVPPRYRRIYPLNSRMPASVVAISPVPDTPAPAPPEIVFDRKPFPRVQDPIPGSPWGGGIGVDSREGTAAEVRIGVGNAGNLGIHGFYAFPSSPRPWSASASWESRGFWTSDARVGVRGDTADGAIPAGDGELTWSPDVPGASALSIRILGTADPGGGGGVSGSLGGVGDFFPIQPWGLVIFGDFVSWDDGGGVGVAGHTGVAGRWRSSKERVGIALGVDLLVLSSTDLRPRPWLEIEGFITPDWGITARGGWGFGYLESLRNAFLDEYIWGWNPRPEAFLDYAVGTDWNPPDGRRIFAEMRWRQGDIITADNTNYVTPRDDRRLGGWLVFHWPAGKGRIVAEAGGEVSLDARPVLWSAEAGYRWDGNGPNRSGPELTVVAGTEDAVLGAGIPGLRSPTPIIGLGAAATPADGLVFDILVYAETYRGFGGVRLDITYHRPPRSSQE